MFLNLRHQLAKGKTCGSQKARHVVMVVAGMRDIWMPTKEYNDKQNRSWPPNSVLNLGVNLLRPWDPGHQQKMSPM